MIDARPWLPGSALCDGVVERVLATRAEAWAARWLREPKCIDVRTTPLQCDTRISSDALVSAADDGGGRGSMSFALERIWLSRLALAMLRIATPRKCSPADAKFLEALAEAAARDFARAAFAFFALKPSIGPATGIAPAGHHHITLSMGAGAPILNLYVSDAALIGTRKRLATAPTVQASLGTRAQAFSGQRLTLGARLGTSRVPLSAVTALAVGDVIVLEQPRCTAVDVTVNGDISAGARWRWSDEALHFKLEQGREFR